MGIQRMNGNIRVGSLFNIPFYVNPSWFLVLGLVTWSYGNGIAGQFPALGAGLPWLLGLFTALLVFASVLAHELGHSVVAIRQGVAVQSITLFLFGGLASLERDLKTPAETFWVAIAGPLTSLILFGLFQVSSLSVGVSWLSAILGVLASVNLALALFNLIPGLPLDGGNVLRALVWKLTGNRYQGVAFASRVGQAFGWFAIATGLLPVLLYGSFDNFWNLLIGGFLLQTASQSAQAARVQERLTGLTAADAVMSEAPVVAAQTTLRSLADQQILSRGQWRKFLVTNEAGQLIGEVGLDALQTIPVEQWSDHLVEEVAQPVEASQMIDSKQPLLDVVKQLEEKKLSTLTVIRENGILVGLLEKSSILALLQRRVETVPA